MANVWTYWHCPYCHSIVRGDCRECPNCGAAIPSDVKYLMPDNPEVIKAIEEGRVFTKESQTVEEAVEYVPEEQESDKANWICKYCDSQNPFDVENCIGCGAGRTEADKNYFGEELRQSGEEALPETLPEVSQPAPDTSGDNNTPSLFKRFLSVLSANGCTVATIALFVALISAILFICIPVEKTATIESFGWERNIAVEEYTLCHESDWNVPAGAEVTSKQQEIHHYDSVLDHYERKSRQVSERVQDGYETHYKDNGNGQAQVVQTPKYKTVYRTEYYDEPVYRQVPRYQTKYYYDIGRWKEVSSLTTSGTDQNPYWHETELPKSVSNPDYGDKRQGKRTEEYFACIVDKDGKEQTKSYDLEEWRELSVGDEIVYKAFRLTGKPV